MGVQSRDNAANKQLLSDAEKRKEYQFGYQEGLRGKPLDWESPSLDWFEGMVDGAVALHSGDGVVADYNIAGD